MKVSGAKWLGTQYSILLEMFVLSCRWPKETHAGGAQGGAPVDFYLW